MNVVIEPVPCRKDNYAYLIRQPGDPAAWVVDPSDAAPVNAALEARQLTLRGILVTHHHHDHVGGIDELSRQHHDVVVAGFAGDRGRIPKQNVFLEAARDSDTLAPLQVAGCKLHVRHIPGHTRGAIALGLSADGDAPTDIFTGDTLFAAGCGRLFEGTADEMWHSLQALTARPEATRLWFGHEYTAANLRFAATVEPANAQIAQRLATVGARSTPTTVALERATNPFVRAPSVAVLAERRAAKDHF